MLALALASPLRAEVALHRGGEEDQPRLQTVLQSLGYWEGTVEVSLALAAKLGTVTLKVAAGPLYRLQQVSLVTSDGGAAAPRHSPRSSSRESRRPA
ncbi:MAG TPA: hypothetical protein VK558_17865 [Patescibacteria group bacterium]|nr:hypothetical protein [Patescibacteria group bacterium]